MSKKNSIGISDDYAVIENEKYHFYYGYEEAIGDDWCFVAREAYGGYSDGKELMRLTSAELKEHCTDLRFSDDCERYLLAGINHFLNQQP